MVQVVGQRPITVTANAGQMKVFGTADPVFTYAVTGGPLRAAICSPEHLAAWAARAVGFYAITIGTLAISDGNGGINYMLTLTQMISRSRRANTTTTIHCSPGTFVYTGAPIEPCSVTVTREDDPMAILYGPAPLSPGDYMNNTAVGTATASYTFAQTASYNMSSDTQMFLITSGTISGMVRYYLPVPTASPSPGVTPKPVPGVLLSAVHLSRLRVSPATSGSTDPNGITT